MLSGPDPSSGALPAGAAVRVNQTLISSQEFEALFEGAAADARQGATELLRARILERLIDEELLIQRALELGLVRHDRRSRSTLVQAVITTVTEAAEDLDPSEAELAKFYERESERFARTGRFHVEQFHFSTEKGVDSATERAQAARKRLQAGEAAALVRAELADEQVFEVPATLLPPAKLRDYVGTASFSAIQDLGVGELTPALESASGIEIFRLVALEPGTQPPLDEVRALVRSEWIRQREDRALEKYLERLKSEAEIVYAD